VNPTPVDTVFIGTVVGCWLILQQLVSVYLLFNGIGCALELFVQLVLIQQQLLVGVGIGSGWLFGGIGCSAVCCSYVSLSVDTIGSFLLVAAIHWYQFVC
jgi:hypothetical protein